ncbi:class I SAM-dependent methyltransferase [Nocardia sp. bgisy134]|uniref:class I SAM-dependent methyltransferase n=1 Tax=Nocardia sp. bgisy134 TaxID=3413789 RepID=UPI003D74E227
MTTADAARAAEEFLRNLHNRAPEAMGRYVAAHRLPDGRTSYQFLAERVARARRVLDLGCGDGALLAVLARDGATGLAGVDISEGELAVARRRPELVDADLREARAQELPFAEDSFDAVVCHMALMLMADVEQVIAETARVLRPGGRLAVVVGARSAEGSGLELFLELARPLFAQRPIPPLGDRRTRSRDGLNELLTAAGFASITWEEITLGGSGTPEQVWDNAIEKYYDTTTLAAEEIAALRREFLARAAALTEDGLLTRGERSAVATTRLPASR